MFFKFRMFIPTLIILAIISGMVSTIPVQAAKRPTVTPTSTFTATPSPTSTPTATGTNEDQPTIRYVKWDAAGANNGTSWSDAYVDLQSALAAASSGDAIWVAAGTYKPTSGTDRSVSFELKNDVAVYGGFAGTETLISQRNPAANLTILSGDIGFPTDISDNSIHVVKGENLNNTAVLDGFTVTRGNADGSYPYNTGGGMHNNNSHPTLHNLIFTGNSGGIGSGMFNSNSSPDLLNVTFSDNHGIAGSRGGAMVNDLNSSPSLVNVTFVNNTVTFLGGGMLNSFNSNPSLVNVTFTGNAAGTYGGAMYNWQSNPILINVTFSGNSAIGGSANGGGAIFNDSNSNPIIVNSIFYGDTGGEIVNYSGSATVSHSIVQGGYPGAGNLDADPLLGPLQDNGGFTQTMALGAGSPAIDAGDDVSCPSADQRGVARPQGSHCDIGAYEYEFPVSPTPTYTPTPTLMPTNTPTPTATSKPGKPTRTPAPTKTPR